MAKITYGVPVIDDTDVAQYYTSVVYDDDHSSARKLVYVDQNSGAEIIIKGSKLDTDAHGIVNKGTISEIDFVDAEDKALLTVKSRPGHEVGLDNHGHVDRHGSLTGAGMHHAYLGNQVQGELEYIFQFNDKIAGSDGGDFIAGLGGNDKINGKGGNDYIAGVDGTDRLTGGTGNDVFEFGSGYGKDVVTDFDAHGEKDLIWALSDDYKIKHEDGNTIISFDDGDTLTLLHVKHLTDADFFHLA
jgi:Ca2+-binding RTX toxin-like protein